MFFQRLTLWSSSTLFIKLFQRAKILHYIIIQLIIVVNLFIEGSLEL